MRVQELLGTWRILKLDLRQQQCFSFIQCLIKGKVFYHASWLFSNRWFYLYIHVFLLFLDRLHMHIWAMFAHSQSQKVLFRKQKGFFCLSFGVCYLEFVTERLHLNSSHLMADSSLRHMPLQSTAQPAWGLQISLATQNLSREVFKCTS